MSNPQVCTVIFTAGATTAVTTAQTLMLASNFVIDGTLASGGVATLDAARRVAFQSSGNEAANIFTIYGTDRSSNVISESLTITNATVALTVMDYLTVTRVAVNAATVGAVSIGTSSATTIGSGPWLPFNPQITPAQINWFVSVAATSASTFTIEVTPDDVNVMTPPGGTAQVVGSGRPPATVPYPGSGSIESASFNPPQPWAAHADVTSKSAATNKFLEVVCMYWRLTINSGTTAVTAQGIQAGIRN